MSNIISSTTLSCRIWILTILFATLGAIVLSLFLESYETSIITFIFIGFFITMLLTIPAFILLAIVIPIIDKAAISWHKKIVRLFLLILIIDMAYSFVVALLNINIFNIYDNALFRFSIDFLIVLLALFTCSFLAILVSLVSTVTFFSKEERYTVSYQHIFKQLFFQSQKTTIIMDYEQTQQPVQSYQPLEPRSTNSNSILIKGIITGVLILVMLVPTFFINNLISERQTRQKEVVKEVSSKWAEAQTLSAPFITVPYTSSFTDNDGKIKNQRNHLILLPDNLNVKGTVFPEVRPRSIYKVLLYKSDIKFEGNFKTTWPADINMANVDFANAKICFSLSDYKGIEEEIFINYNNEKLLLSQGLSVNDLGDVGLSCPILLNAEQLKTGIRFDMQIKLKGSEQLHFLPLSGNSKFDISSSWSSPSFDGNSLPNEWKYIDSGFNAKWNFNKANLPFGTVVREGLLKASPTAFGVSLVQPADQYNKTSRSVKYAILLIGLTFALFFIIELMQKKPLHPVQYILVGIALVIFYTLLLSISEYILFDYAYLTAAVATILLITFYAKGHFGNWKSASIFGSLLTCLYGFIFVLIRLEDTALLVGSIGLFIILALVMYGSRKINWYGNGVAPINNQIA
jgi:inner membrane protein